jgi:outer membrane protein assembly factor BamB
MPRPFACTLCILVVLASENLFAQQSWSRFRGPNGTGVVADATLPATWSEPKWTVDLAGAGSSSPVAWNDRLFVTSCDMDTAEIHIQCLSLDTGNQKWVKHFESEPYHLHGRNTYAASTPAVDADYVFLTFAAPESTMLIALDHEGNEVWRRDFGRWVSSHGFGMSPIIHGDHVIFCNSQSREQLPAGVAPGASRLIAVDRKTGEDAWSLELTTKRVCYGVPCLWRDADGNQQLVNCNTGDGFYSVDPATGVKNWSALPFKMRVVASPLVAGDLLIGSCGSGGGGNYLVAMKPGEVSTDVAAQPVYRVRQSNYVPSPIAVGDLLFVFTDKGIVQCMDLKTGEPHWKERLSSGFSASPVASGSQVYAVDEDGVVFVIKAAAAFEKLGKIPLGESTRATPMIANDRLYFRTRTKLICVE